MEDIGQLPEELKGPVSALVQAAMVFRGAFVRAGEGTPVEEVLDQYGETLLLAEKVLDQWTAHRDLIQLTTED